VLRPGPSHVRPYASNPSFQTVDCKCAFVKPFRPSHRLPLIERTGAYSPGQRCNYFTKTHSPLAQHTPLSPGRILSLATTTSPHAFPACCIACKCPTLSLTKSLTPYAQIIPENTTETGQAGRNCSPTSLLYATWRKRFGTIRNPCSTWWGSRGDSVQGPPPPLSSPYPLASIDSMYPGPHTKQHSRLHPWTMFKHHTTHQTSLQRSSPPHTRTLTQLPHTRTLTQLPHTRTLTQLPHTLTLTQSHSRYGTCGTDRVCHAPCFARIQGP